MWMGGWYAADYSVLGPRAVHLFMHEIGHVVQFQEGEDVFAQGRRTLLTGGYIGGRAYRYLDRNGRLANAFCRLNFEARAELVADYFSLAEKGD